MQIITISREFGSGGRELGKRMADLLQVTYYDREIVTAVAEKNQMDKDYVSEMMEKGMLRSFPITIGRTFSYTAFTQNSALKILVAQQKIIKELAAQGDCVMMGQSADVILQEHHPLNFFVYAEMTTKIRRCREQAVEGESFTEGELKKKIKQVDAGRAQNYELVARRKWGAKENYNLCINTTDIEIKTLAPPLAEYAKYWLELENHENTIIRSFHIQKTPALCLAVYRDDGVYLYL